MKRRRINYFKYFSLFFAMIVLVLIAGCTGAPPAVPIINSFLANPLTITVGESSNLSWSVTDATTVTIDNGIGSVALSGTTTVTPVTTTTYTLTATNTAGSVTATTTITVNPVAITHGSIDIKSTPPGAKVYLDGVDTGQATPIILPNIEEGSHTIKLDLFYYKIWEENVNVTANETTYRNPPLIRAAREEIILQPGLEGKDAPVHSSFPENNYGDGVYSLIGGFPSNSITRLYIQFDLSSIPENARVIDAYLDLYQFLGLGTGNFTIGLYNVTSDWEESTISWSSQPTSSTDAGITNNITAEDTGWEYWNIKTLVQNWLDETIANYGMVLKDTDETLVELYAIFRTSDYTIDTTKRPKLVVDYYIP